MADKNFKVKNGLVVGQDIDVNGVIKHNNITIVDSTSSIIADIKTSNFDYNSVFRITNDGIDASLENYALGNLYINAQNSNIGFNAANTFEFNLNGNSWAIDSSTLVFPDGSLQTTAFVGYANALGDDFLNVTTNINGDLVLSLSDTILANDQSSGHLYLNYNNGGYTGTVLGTDDNSGAVILYTNGKWWQFTPNGELTFPDGTQQTTAWIPSTIDSAYVQARQITYTNVSEFVNDANYLSSGDSIEIANLVATGNVIIGGNLQVNGTTVTVNTTNMEVSDNMIYMNAVESSGSPTASIDVGWAANVNNTGTYAHVGMFRDATDNTFKVFEGYVPEPDASVQINTSHATFSLAPFAARTLSGSYLGFDSDVLAASLATEAYVTTTIDSAYINARVVIPDAGIDSAVVFNLIDSAYINARVVIPDAGIDSASVTAIIDSAYINARVVIPDAGIDSAAVAGIVDSAIQASFVDQINFSVDHYKFIADSGQSIFTGLDANGNTLVMDPNSVIVSMNGVMLVYGEDYTVTSSSLTLTAPAEANYEVCINSLVSKINFNIDSAVGLIVDSSYINARVVIPDVPVDSAVVFNLIDATYINSLVNGVDSSAVTSIIDSAYINARVVIPDVPVDSAVVFNLIDSAYVQLRQEQPRTLIIGDPVLNEYKFIADSGQTIFSDSDANGNVLALGSNNYIIFINGVRITDDDFTADEANDTITLTDAALLSDEVIINVFDKQISGGNFLSGLKSFYYTATAGQLTFSGADNNGQTLWYIPGSIQAFLNGINLLDGVDYTATNGTSIIMIDPAEAGSELIINAFNTKEGAIDSATVQLLIDSAYINARVVIPDVPVDSAVVFNLIDSAYINDRVVIPDVPVDSSVVLTLIDSAYINDRVVIPGLSSWKEVTSNYSIATGGEKLIVDTTSAITLTLPATATLGDEIRIIDGAGTASTNNITVAVNGHYIQGDSGDLIVDINRAAFGLVYYNATNGWLFTEK